MSKIGSDSLFKFDFTLLSFEILSAFFLAGFLIIFSKFMIDNRMFRRPLSPQELFKQYKPEIEDLISRGEYFAAYLLACKWRIQDFFDWPEEVTLIVNVVNDFLKEGKYSLAYSIARAWGILGCWDWPYLPLPEISEPEDQQENGTELEEQN